MDPARYDVQRILIDKEGRWQPRPISPEPGGNPGIDVVFPVLHGTFGEDGTVQGLLELADLPYVGAGVLASAVSMDKEVMKRLCVERGLPVVEYMSVRRGQVPVTRRSAGKFPFPVFVKPANLGSSVGRLEGQDLRRAEGRARIGRAVRPQNHGRARHSRARVRMLRARQRRSRRRGAVRNSAVARILRLRRQVSVEPSADRGARRSHAGADAEIRRLAVECYQAVDCEGMARVDFLLEAATGKFFINEINTIPGFTSISMYPKMWEASGLAYATADRPLDRTRAGTSSRQSKPTRYSR